MSEPMKNREIEDVLSSIRRLVSEENAAVRTSRMDRLVLTPALRILPPPAPREDDPPVEPEPSPIGVEAAILPFEMPAPPPVPEPASAAAEESEPEVPESEPSLEDRIATLEAAISLSHDDFEPDGTEDAGPLAPEAIAFPQVPAPEPEPEPRPLPARQTHAATALEEALIDEDSLREIVSQLVREELRGELGERITRNVRRLIRREIQQALALKDFEAED
jgi:hypothetical protein